MDALLQHSLEMEKAFLFGQKGSTTGSNGQPLRTTQGIVNFLTTNVINFNGVVTEPNWDAQIEQIFRIGSDEKLALAGGIALNVLNQMAKNKNTLNAVPGGETYGYKLKRYETPFGDLLLYKHPLMAINTTFAKQIIVIDMTRIRYRYITETTLQENVQNPGDDQRIDQFLTECGSTTGRTKSPLIDLEAEMPTRRKAMRHRHRERLSEGTPRHSAMRQSGLAGIGTARGRSEAVVPFLSLRKSNKAVEVHHENSHAWLQGVGSFAA